MRREFRMKIPAWSPSFKEAAADLIGRTFWDHGVLYVVTEVKDYPWQGQRRRKCIAIPHVWHAIDRAIEIGLKCPTT